MLGVSIKTVDAHTAKIYRKRGVNSRYELMAQFMQAALPQPGETFTEDGCVWELYEYAEDSNGLPHAIVIEAEWFDFARSAPSRIMTLETVRLAFRQR